MAVHFIETVDDRDPPSALGRRGGEEARQGPCFGYRDLAAKTPRLVVDGPLDGDQIGVGAACEAAKDRVLRCQGEPAAIQRRGALACEDVTGETEGERRLADPPLAGDQPRVAETAPVIGAQKRLLGVLVSDQVGVLARARPRRGLGI